MALRPTTNLVVPDDLKLPPEELKSGFMYLYTGAFPGKEIVFISRLWASTLFPTIGNDPRFGADAKALRKGEEVLAKTTPSGYLKLKKVLGGGATGEPYFKASIPVFIFHKNNPSDVARTLNNFFLGYVNARSEKQANADEVSEIQQFADRIRVTEGVDKLTTIDYSADRLIANDKRLDANAKLQLRKCLLGMRVELKGDAAIIFLDFKITRAEAEQLTVTPWLELRNVDLYPLLLQWVASGFGSRAAVAGAKKIKTPTASFSVSKIARSLPKDQSAFARVNEHSLSIAPNGHPVWLPKTLDNTKLYEDAYSVAAMREGDDSFALLDINDAASALQQQREVQTKLPKNVPVLIDWVNNKYAYTMTNRMLKVQDLTRFRKANDSHIHGLLTTVVMEAETLNNMILISAKAGVNAANFIPKLQDLEGIQDQYGNAIQNTYAPQLQKLVSQTSLLDYYKHAVNLYAVIEGEDTVRMEDISIHGHPLFRPIARFLTALHAGILSNLAAVYEEYSVSYVSEYLGWITLISQYTHDMAGLRLRDQTLRAAAINQRVDPDWEVPSIPLAEGIPGFLPHQKKVRNLLKDSPDFAILPVQAGGGKTPVIVTDILLEIKANRSAPYLIMCPSTLVAQYMKEIAKFTKGKLNVIPVTTKSVVKQGFERLTQMIERAPRNTVVITDYNVLRYQPSGSVASVCYGTTGIELFPVIDLLRQFNFQYVALDESQYVKGDSARTRAAMALIVDIPKKRLASGTMAHDSPSDLANQIAMLDPTIFGSRDNFNATYGEVVKGDRVIKWKGGAANAARRIMSRIKERVVVAGAMRKEWAALLPELDSRYRGVRLTPKQQEVYEIILNQILERLEQEAKKNAGLAAFFQGKGGLEQDPEAKKEADADENEGEGLEALLQVHLARLEQYLTAPARDVLGNEMLKGDDRKSPVVLEIERLLRLHIQGGMDRAHDARDTEGPTMQPPRHGKVLIFCNYVESAEEIYAQMPPDLQRMGILYKANEKTEAGAAFEKDPRIKWMVGVSSSMDTGLNLQFCSRLIRAETVWNPGTLEQGNARINRPEFNPNNDRDMIWFDTIVVDRTISTTKASRLISKVIAVAKFDNEGNHLYDDVPDVDVVPMNLDAIRELNSWSQDLKPYLEAYRELNKAQKEDYKQYRVSQGWPEKMTAADRQKLIQKFEYAEDPADAMAMVDSPYVGGLELYNSDKLGLIRVDLYLSMEDTGAEEIEFDEDGDVGEARRAAKARLYEVSKKLHGTRTYTQFGEGIIRSINLTVNEAIVDLDVGYAVQLRNSEIFISKDPNKPLHNIRQKLIAEIGLPAAAPTSDIRPAGFKFDRKAAKLAQERLKEAEKKGLVKRKTGRQLREEAEETQSIEEAISVELHFLNVNGFLGLSFFTEDSDERAQSALQALGFRPGQDFVYAEFANAQRLVKQFDLWAEKGFEIAPDAIEQGVSDGIRAMHELLKTKKIAQHRQVTKMATQSQMRNFYRIEHKANNNRKMIKPYALIEDGRAYIALPLAGQSGTRNAIKYRAPGVKWTFSEPYMSFFGQTKAKIGQMIKRILSMGIQISNVDDLRKQAAQIKQMSQTQFRKGSDVFLGE